MNETVTVHDPICHMDIEPARAAGISEHKGTTYYFCSGGCKKDFDAAPEAALQAEITHDHSRPVSHMMMMMDDELQSGGSSAATGNAPRKPWWRFW